VELLVIRPASGPLGCSGFPKRSCSIKELKRDDDSSKISSRFSELIGKVVVLSVNAAARLEPPASQAKLMF
jgi:hypothetical protein